MTRRPGLSLIEVLTALFIMGIGAIAILTLFPLGAINMANANRDDRSALAAFGAGNYFRTYWKTNVVEAPNPPGIAEEFYYTLDNPNYPTPPTVALPLPGLNEASYPVFVDPMGYAARADPARKWVGDSVPGPQTNIPRRNINAASTAQLAQRLCSLMDTIGADESGVPNDERELRYNFLWVIQRPNNANKTTANMTVVVFHQRANLFAPPGSEQVLSTVANGVVPGATSVTFATAPDLKPGAWIMDGTINPAGRPSLRQANFYRVTAFDANTNTVELQSPIKTPSDNGGAYTGTFVILRGVAGVFVRPVLSSSD